MVDDFVPCGPDNEPCFSVSQSGDIWVLILEKAWAKIHRSYERLNGGHADFVYRDLTGAPSYDYQTSEPQLFEKMLEGQQRGFAMSTSITTKSESETLHYLKLGLLPEHSYSILDVIELTASDMMGNKRQF